VSRLRIFWSWNSRPEVNHTDMEIGPDFTGEAQIREAIGTALGDRTLAQYIAIDFTRIERAPLAT
jgi:hypothetical protein